MKKTLLFILLINISVSGICFTQVTFHNLDKFSYIGAFSGTMNGLNTGELDPQTAFNGIFKDGKALNKQIRLLWIGKGRLVSVHTATVSEVT